MTTALYGGVFDPPHNGHVALLREAQKRFAPEATTVLVAAAPGHKATVASADERLELARAAFPGEDVRLDEHERSVDTLRAGPWRDPIFLIGADEFCHFLDWKEPQEVLELARLGVATRPGYPRERLENVLRKLEQPERVLFFDLEPYPIASREVRDRIAREESVDDEVPPAVAELIRRHDLYRG